MNHRDGFRYNQLWETQRTCGKLNGPVGNPNGLVGNLKSIKWICGKPKRPVGDPKDLRKTQWTGGKPNGPPTHSCMCCASLARKREGKFVDCMHVGWKMWSGIEAMQKQLGHETECACTSIVHILQKS